LIGQFKAPPMVTADYGSD